MEYIKKSDLEEMLQKTLKEFEAEYEEISKGEESTEELELSEATSTEELVEKAEDESDDKEDEDDEDDKEDLKKPMKKSAKMKKEEKEDDDEDEHEDKDQDKKLIQDMIDDSKKSAKMKKAEDKIAELEKALTEANGKIESLSKSLEDVKKSTEVQKTEEAPKVEAKKEEQGPSPSAIAPLVKNEEAAPKHDSKQDILNKCYAKLTEFDNSNDHTSVARLQKAVNKFDLTEDFELVKHYIDNK